MTVGELIEALQQYNKDLPVRYMTQEGSDPVEIVAQANWTWYEDVGWFVLLRSHDKV